MPKLTDEEYLIRHKMLHRVWGKDDRTFSYLSYQQQRDLHDYYAPAKTLTNDELLAYRKRVTKKNPALPQRASRAFLVMLRPDTQPESLPTNTNSKGRKITVHSVVQPEINMKKLAQALLQLAESMTPEEQAEFLQRYEADQKRAA